MRRRNIRHLVLESDPDIRADAQLARRELRISLEEWMKRTPPFEAATDDRAPTRGRGVGDVKRVQRVWKWGVWA